MSINSVLHKKISAPITASPQYETTKANQANNENATLKGFLLNNNIKKQDCKEDCDCFEKISSELMIPDTIIQEENEEKKEDLFNYKKLLKPLAITAGITLGAIGIISLSLKKYSKTLASKDGFVHPGDLARNINILEEPQFAMYRALRDPSAKNVIGFGAVVLMSATTLIAKHFIDGAKEVWIKKQNCNITHDLQENLIDVEAKAFKGKLNVVNSLLKNTTEYFKDTFAKNKTKQNTSFKGKAIEDSKSDSKDEKKKSKIKTLLLAGIGALGFIGMSYAIFRNYQKTAKNLDTFVNRYGNEGIQKTIKEATNISDKAEAKKQLISIFKTINAKKETMQENFSKIGLTQDEINSAIKEVQAAQIYAQAPEALGGISEKIQYYCYINEERGHLYNWILNPESKFNKYLFLSFSAISSVGYIAKTCADAIKEVAVGKENSKSELELRKKLVSTEINNFKAKKMSVITPMIENFNSQKAKGKSEEELKTLAENILIEIKNGPPYVYN